MIGSLSYSRALTPELTLQLVAAAEYSTISQGAGGRSSRSFFRPKGSVSLAWKPSQAVRPVGQGDAPRVAAFARRIPWSPLSGEGEREFGQCRAGPAAGLVGRTRSEPLVRPLGQHQAAPDRARCAGLCHGRAAARRGRIDRQCAQRPRRGDRLDHHAAVRSARLARGEARCAGAVAGILGWPTRSPAQPASIPALPSRLIEVSLRHDVPGTPGPGG